LQALDIDEKAVAMKGIVVRLPWILLPLLFIAGAGACERLGAKVEAQQVEEYSLDPTPLEAAGKSGIPPPVLVMRQLDPWKMVIGSDSPAFALYADGTVIFREGERYKSVRLTATEQQDLIGSLGIEDLSALKGHYQTTATSDQTQSYIFVYSGTDPFYISTYGSLSSSETRSTLPDEIVHAYDRLDSFSHPNARDWLPASIEVMIWPYEYAPGQSIVWPSDWPGLDSPTTVQRGEHAFSLYVPSVQLGRLTAFLGTRRPKGAVEIGGKKWAASTRFPFPHEQLWMAPETR
jgi:hypothetical protein